MSANNPTAAVVKAVAEYLAPRLGEKIPVVTMLSGAWRRELFVTPSTACVVRANVTGQLHEPLPLFTLTLSARLTVRVCGDEKGEVFAEAHDALWRAFLALSRGDECETLTTDAFAVDGFQIESETESTLETTDGVEVWTGGISATLTGRALNIN